jgi:polysaccharide export outer membrane protein
VVKDPEVTIIVQEARSQSFNVMGEVQKPGAYPLGQRLTVMDAIALAGGFRDFAKVKHIYVLRSRADGKSDRLPSNYKKALGGDQAQTIFLQPRDTVVVP